MKRNQLFLAVTIALGSAAVAGCGDNSKQCGAGTKDIDGVCTGGGNAVCGDGTQLDEATGECVPSDAACGDGTVLVGGVCKDPTSGLVIDLEEGPEPNGFEMGATPAGNILLKPAGEHFIIHGCIKPTDNFTADIDDYTLTVTAPTLIKVSADGVKGLAAGFIALGDPNDALLANWVRLGLNVVTDTSKRELFLPAAGTYDIVIADSRTLYPITEGINDLPPAGNPDGTSCYFVTVDSRTITPTALNLTTGDSGTIGEDLKFYNAALPTGFVSMSAVVDPEDLDGDGVPDVNSRAASSLVILNNNALRQINDSDSTTPISSAFFAGIKTGDNPLIVLDYVWNYAVGPADYAVAIDAAINSDALSTTGTAVSATGGSHGQFFVDPAGPGNVDFTKINLFHWDVAGSTESDGFDLTASIDLEGLIADQDGFIISDFSSGDFFNGNNTSSTTFKTYLGQLRTARPGRYYFVTFAPRVAVATAFTVTSTITPLTPTVVVLDTPSAAQTVNQFNSNAMSYDAGTAEPWQLLNATGVGTGVLTATTYNPTAAFGRLDNIVQRTGGGAGTAQPPLASDVPNAGVVTFAANGSTPAGRILLNPLAAQPPALTQFFVKVNPTIATGARTFIADIRTRVYHDFATLAASTTTSVNNEPLNAANPTRRYFLRTDPGNTVTITVTPNTATLNPVIGILGTTEVETVHNTGLVNQPEVFKFAQNASGFTAFQVRAAGAILTQDFTLDVKIDPPFYTVHNSATAFADACTGGTTQTLASGDTDEGLTGVIAAPAGFTFYGAAATNFVASTNGFLSFNTGISNSNFNVTSLPDGVGDTSIAPLWDDLDTIVICTKTVAGKLVVQWTGAEFLFGTPAQFQAILDPTDDSIEFVWGPNNFSDGSTGFGTVSGVQNLTGDEATEVGEFSQFALPNTSKKLTHP